MERRGSNKSFKIFNKRQTIWWQKTRVMMKAERDWLDVVDNGNGNKEIEQNLSTDPYGDDAGNCLNFLC